MKVSPLLRGKNLHLCPAAYSADVDIGMCTDAVRRERRFRPTMLAAS